MSAKELLQLRVQLTKKDMMRFLSHSEFARTLMLAGRRSGLPLQYSGKFRPRMKISLSPPLPIGITSDCELTDFFLTKYVSPLEAQNRINESLPDGIDVVRCRLIGSDARPVGKLIDTASYSVVMPAGTGPAGDWEKAVEIFIGMEAVSFERVQPRRTRVVDLRPGVHRLEVVGEPGGEVRINMVLDDGTRGTVKAWEVIEALAGLVGKPMESVKDAHVNRDGLYARRGKRLVSPMDLGVRKPAV